MFYGSISFDSDISKWDVSSAEHMEHMFASAESFDTDLYRWDVSRVVLMTSMFYQATKFTGKGLKAWNVLSLEDTSLMFNDDDLVSGDDISEDLDVS